MVVDTQGGRVPGVSVTTTNQDTGLTRVTVTNGQGEYRVGALPSGRYEVVAEIAGFEKQVGRF
jgi:hypothetical protein